MSREPTPSLKWSVPFSSLFFLEREQTRKEKKIGRMRERDRLD